MKKKLKTDGINGLLEIVKAVQQGEDPEEMLRRKEEQCQEAEQEKQRQEREQEKQRQEAEQEKQRQEREQEKLRQKAEWEEEETESENQEKRRKTQSARKPGGILAGISDALGVLRSLKAAKGSSQKSKVSGNIYEENTEEPSDAAEKKQLRQQPEMTEEQQIFSGSVQEPEKNPELPREKSEDERIFERLLERNGISPDEIEEEDFDEELKARSAAEAEHKKDGRVPLSVQGIRDYLPDLIENLRVRGISRKELLMIAAGVVLAILVLAFIWNGITSMIHQRQKSEHVTADSGLTVTVEKEPEEWCRIYPVELKFKASGAKVLQVSVNGIKYLPDENGMITVETGEWLLETTAVLEDGSQLAARIEIPKLDAQSPVVSAARDETLITLTAADARSEVTGIYYAAVSSCTPWQLPQYQLYTEPLTYQKDTLYCFYAEDAAGNRSVPTQTTMEQAESVELDKTELALFPGETRTLNIVTEPEYAFLENVRFESTDASVASVDGAGNVTAQAEGTATIKAIAWGPDNSAEASLACTVTVSRSRSVTVSAIGDCTLGTDEAFNTMTNFDAFEEVNGKAYFFHNVKEILSSDDVTFANLEGTFTTETARAQKEYAFKGDPSYTEILQNGSVDVVTLANNHSSDYGEKSLEDTKGYLTAAEIDYCIGDTIVMKEVNGISMAFIGIYVLNDGLGREAQVRETIGRAKEQGASLIITAFHWGSEKATAPDETQTTLAHLAVDCGANLVVGHHPHVLQGIEKYKGAYIVYSLGNFCFGGNSTPSDMDTMIFRQTFTITDGTVLDDDETEVIPCSISSTSNYNNYQPTPAEGAEAERIMQKINNYSGVYGQSFAAPSGT